VGYIYRGRIHTNWLYIFLDWHHLERLIEDNSSRLLADRDRGARCSTNWAQKVVNHGLSHTFSLPAGFMNGGVPPVRARTRAAIPAPLRQPRAPKLSGLAAAPGAVETPWPPTHGSAPAVAYVRVKVAVSYSSWCGYSRSDVVHSLPASLGISADATAGAWPLWAQRHLGFVSAPVQITARFVSTSVMITHAVCVDAAGRVRMLLAQDCVQLLLVFVLDTVKRRLTCGRGWAGPAGAAPGTPGAACRVF